MNLLLDTHIILWFLNRSPLLRPAVQAIIQSASTVWISPVSIAEISIKTAAGKIEVPLHYMEVVRSKKFPELPLSITHAARMASLPSLHKDPFDRMLVAQALCEGLTIVTEDAHIRRYDVPTLEA